MSCSSLNNMHEAWGYIKSVLFVKNGAHLHPESHSAPRTMSTVPRPRKVSRRLNVYLDETECLASQMGLTKTEADRALYREILVCLPNIVVSVTR